MDEIRDKYIQFSMRLSDYRLVECIENIERLIDSDDFNESFFIDEAFIIYDVFRDECVRRVKYGICLKDVEKKY